VRNKLFSCQKGLTLTGDPSRGVQKCASNLVLSRGINPDGRTRFEGYKSGRQTLSCQEGSSLMERFPSRGAQERAANFVLSRGIKSDGGITISRGTTARIKLHLV